MCLSIGLLYRTTARSRYADARVSLSRRAGCGLRPTLARSVSRLALSALLGGLAANLGVDRLPDIGIFPHFKLGVYPHPWLV
jgi:hypothetical protein